MESETLFTPMGITRMRLSFQGDQGAWEYTNGQGDNVLRFGIGRVISGKFPQRNYCGEQIGVLPGIKYDCLASAAWVDEQTFNLEVYITDNHLGGLRSSFSFKGGEIGVFMTKQYEHTPLSRGQPDYRRAIVPVQTGHNIRFAILEQR